MMIHSMGYGMQAMSSRHAAKPLFRGSQPEIRKRITHELELHEDLVDGLLDGSKQATIRYGYNFIDSNVINFTPVSGPGVRSGQPIAVDFIGLEIVPFGELTQAHVDLQGGGTLADLKNGLRGFYGNIPDDYPMTVIRFANPRW